MTGTWGIPDAAGRRGRADPAPQSSRLGCCCGATHGAWTRAWTSKLNLAFSSTGAALERGGSPRSPVISTSSFPGPSGKEHVQCRCRMTVEVVQALNKEEKLGEVEQRTEKLRKHEDQSLC